MSADAEVVAVGRITRAHGVKGEVAVMPLSQVRSRFQPGSRLLAGPGRRPVTVASSRPHGKRLLVRFEEVADRTEAEALGAPYLFVAASEVPPLPRGEYWPHQLVGCEVRSDGGRRLGEIREVVAGQANDLWVAEGAGDRELLIPALRDVVVSVDVEARRVVVREVPGLTVAASEEERA